MPQLGLSYSPAVTTPTTPTAATAEAVVNGCMNFTSAVAVNLPPFGLPLIGIAALLHTARRGYSSKHLLQGNVNQSTNCWRECSNTC
mmetsp:Transcript_121209/g.241452  ORF Transcript_121209/g.241452 Transcript_121209/m.241452 type:complete len:87 (-) Transcript_121209:6-266(-)